MFTARDDLADQPTRTPTRKVSASAASGFVVVLVLAILGAVGVEVPGVNLEDLPVTEAFTGLAMFLTAYFTREFR